MGAMPTSQRVAPLLAARFLHLQESKGSQGSRIPQAAMGIHTPLKVEAWAQALGGHPNRAWADCLVTCLREGVRIGFNPNVSCGSAKANMQSATAHPDIVEQYLLEEIALDNVAGPFPLDPLKEFVTLNRFGVIPKANKPGKWRLIVDLSYPHGNSVNDGIPTNDASMAYSSIEDAGRIIANLGKNTLLAKIDIASAFRIIPVHPEDRHLLGMKWKNEIYIDKQLPFGLRSAPILFNALADALEWILRERGISNVIHYLDDFLVFGSPGSKECSIFLECMQATCSELGVPLALDKIAGPCTRLTFLGIELDTEKMQALLPADKLLRLKVELHAWQDKKSCTRKDLEHLIGLLQFAVKVVPQGRPFVRRMINLLSVAKEGHHHIRLNAEFRSDLAWWCSYVGVWNGISFLNLCKLLIPSCNVFTDASGSFGCGACWGTLWLQGQWPPEWASINIMVKELVPVVLACALWGSQWAGRHVLFHIDNLSVIQVLQKGASKEPSGVIMHLLRCLSFLTAYFHFSISASHIAGVYNIVADDISRNNLGSLLIQVPGIQPQPVPIPDPLWSLLVLERPDWTSKRWRLLFSDFTSQA